MTVILCLTCVVSVMLLPPPHLHCSLILFEQSLRKYFHMILFFKKLDIPLIMMIDCCLCLGDGMAVLMIAGRIKCYHMIALMVGQQATNIKLQFMYRIVTNYQIYRFVSVNLLIYIKAT